MKVDAELTTAGFDNKSRAKFFKQIWHPYLPQKVSVMQLMADTYRRPTRGSMARAHWTLKCMPTLSYTRYLTLHHALIFKIARK
jgi:hypothetical protein